jgi:PKD repeat protein
MNKKLQFTLVAALAVSIVSLTTLSKKESSIKEAYKGSHLKNSSGAPNKKTGAPGEGSCIDCHNGTVQDGANVNLLVMFEEGTTNPISNYTPGVTYDMSLIIVQASSKNGFQTVVLKTSDDTQAGSVAGVAGSTATVTFQNRSYVNHTSASNSQGTFNFKWTAPATDEGDVKFYMASNKTNNNGNSSGDDIFLSQHLISPVVSTAPVSSFNSSATTICANNSVTYTNTSTGNQVGIIWSFQGGTPSTSTDQNPVVFYANPGNFTTTLSVTDGANASTSSSTIDVQNCASVDKNDKDLLVVYPNPTSDKLSLKNINTSKYNSIKLIDLSGKTVKSWKINEESENLDLSDIQAGSYLIKVLGKSETITKSITKY